MKTITKTYEPQTDDLRVWWIPQVPMEPFLVKIQSVEEGRQLQSILAAYDFFQFDNYIKPDYSNVGGMERFEDGEWVDVDEEET
jgi:hypothetical protein